MSHDPESLTQETPPAAPLGSQCPRSKLDYLNLETGQRIPLRCRSNRCYVCGPINARMIAKAQARSKPERMFRFSLVPTSWTLARLKMTQVRERLADLGYRNEWAYSLEPNPSGEDLAHAHGVQHGPDKLPQELLQEICQAQGLGIPWIARIKGGDKVTSYGVKAAGAAFYGVKSAKEAQDHQEDYKRFLDLNGGRISHHTRGFYRLPNGQKATQGEAIAACIAESRQEHAQEESSAWHVVAKDLSLQSARLRSLRVAGTRTVGLPL